MKTSTLLALFLLVSVSLSGAAELSKNDQKFLTDAAQGGMLEVQLGKVAVAKASDPKVKDFGQRMVDDHGKANQQLEALAKGKDLQLPDGLDKKNEQTLSDLSAATSNFDSRYVDMMVEDHKKDVAEFEKAAKSAEDPDVRKFAADTLPVLKDHLEQIQEIQQSM